MSFAKHWAASSSHILKKIPLTRSKPGIAKSITDDMLIEFGGQVVYMKNGAKDRVSEKHKQILADFNGNNHAEIYKKYSIGAAWLQRLLKRAAQNEPAS